VVGGWIEEEASTYVVEIADVRSWDEDEDSVDDVVSTDIVMLKDNDFVLIVTVGFVVVCS
jgi:hypothetical protein